MRRSRIAILVGLLCSVTFTALGQTLVARMTDEFRTAGNNCEDGLARLDAFLAELHNDPGSAGVVVAYGEIGDAKASSIRVLQLKRYAEFFRRFDIERITFVSGIARESGTTQFWIVPPGAERPEIVEAPRPDPKYRPTLPYMFAATYLDGLPECIEYEYDLKEFARVVNIEPKARARVIIRESSRAKFNKEASDLIATLGANGVPRSRIITDYKYVRPMRLAEGKELWVIPARN